MKQKNEINIEDFFKNLFTYISSLYRLQILKLGKTFNKIINIFFIFLISIIFLPIILILLFVGLSLFFCETFKLSCFTGFLLGTLSVMVLCVILFFIGKIFLRKPKIKLYKKLLQIIGKIPLKEQEKENNFSPEEEKDNILLRVSSSIDTEKHNNLS